MENNQCPICLSHAKTYNDSNVPDIFERKIDCPVCGKYVINESPERYSEKPKDADKLASYLFYNRKKNKPINVDDKDIYHYIGPRNRYEEFRKTVSCYWVTNDAVESWYPRTIKEKKNMFLVYLYENSHFMGEYITFDTFSLCSACFSIRKEKNSNIIDHSFIENQSLFLLGNLTRNHLIKQYSAHFQYSLTVDGLSVVEELTSNSRQSKTAFVAMSFKEEMISVRNAIRSAIEQSGFVPRIMDEVEHNHQIVPEMLHEIRQSRFVIAELTNHNNGAYFEAGYALGQGKEVIQLCRNSTFHEDGHFDVRQVNTILWDNENDLIEKLKKRIKATIE